MTIKEIARLAGVSVSTVSKVMNNKDASISSDTRERVLQIAKQFHYSPYSASSTRRTKSFLLGILLSSSDTFKMFDGILEEAQKQGYQVLAFKTCDGLKSEEDAIDALCKYHVDAILWQPAEHINSKLEKKLRCQNIPYLTLPSADLFFDDSNLDFSKISYTATEAFIRAGHRNIAFLSSPSAWDNALFKGYKKALFDAGLSFQDTFLFRQMDELLLARIASGFITAIVLSRCSDAIKLYDILTRRHFQIPRDLSLITLKDDQTETALIPQISSIDFPYHELGRHLAKNLISLLEQTAAPAQFSVNCQISHMASVCPPQTLQKKHMVVIGSINIDNYLTVNKLPVSGMTSNISNLSLYPGGKAVNIAVGISRLGAEAGILGAIGNDLDSDLIFSSLEEHAIMTNKLLRFSNVPTGRAFIFVQPDGESTISLLTGANAFLTPSHVIENQSVFQNCCCCLMQTEIPSEPLVAAARLAHGLGIPIILKPSASTHLDPELMQYTDIIVPNQNELNVLARGNTFQERVQFFLDSGISTVIVTHGEGGCTLKTRQTEKHFPVPYNFTSVDNTGAGDAFIAALSVYLENGYAMETAIQIAQYAAGFCISREGVALSMIDKNTLESFIRKQAPALLESLRDTGTHA